MNARARKSDPIGSHVAAEKIAEVAKAQNMAVLDAMREYPGLSTRALAERSGLDRYVVARRASELLKAGLVWRVEGGKCQATGHTAALWYPKGAK